MSKSELYNYFKPAEYLLSKNDDNLHLIINGQKTGPPSHRISLHQAGLKISGAKITRYDKHGPVEIEINRINHLPTIQQVRLHSSSIIYPGRYQIEVNYKINSEKLDDFNDIKLNRENLPSVDEFGAWQSAKFEFKQ